MIGRPEKKMIQFEVCFRFFSPKIEDATGFGKKILSPGRPSAYITEKETLFSCMCLIVCMYGYINVHHFSV